MIRRGKYSRTNLNAFQQFINFFVRHLFSQLGQNISEFTRTDEPVALFVKHLKPADEFLYHLHEAGYSGNAHSPTRRARWLETVRTIKYREKCLVIDYRKMTVRNESRITRAAYYRVVHWMQSLPLPPVLDFALVHAEDHREPLSIRRRFHVYQTEQMLLCTLQTLNIQIDIDTNCTCLRYHSMQRTSNKI